MKKTILTGIIAFCLYATHSVSQLTVIDMRTGIVNDPYASYAPYPPVTWPNIPLYMPDDTWQLKIPGGNYGPVYPTTGLVSGYMTPSSYGSIGETFQQIMPGYTHRVLAPFRVNGGDINLIPAGQAAGKYIYRMQFPFDLNCNTVTSAQIKINRLAGDGITRLLVNGYVYPLPTYPTVTGYSFTDFLNINDSWYHNTTPFFPSMYGGPLVPATQYIAINPWDIHSNNSIYIELDPSTTTYGHTDIAALIVDAELEIYHTSTAIPENQIDFSGSTKLVCSGTNGNIDIDLSAAFANNPNFAGYMIEVIPSGYSAQPVQVTQSFYLSPVVSTNYEIILTDPNTGCKSHFFYKINVSPPAPYLGGSNPVICASAGGVIRIELEGPYHVTVVDADDLSQVFYDGDTENADGVSVPIYPTSETHYKIIITDPETGCSRQVPWNVTIDPNCRVANATGIAKNTSLQNAISVTPNPSQGIFSLKTEVGASGIATLFDASGKLIKKLSLKKESVEYSIDLTAYPKGIYLLNVDSDKGHVSKKIVLE